jgi:predicted small lipoprotein YifL
VVKKLKVGHYNFTMLKTKNRRLGMGIALAGVLNLAGCGQTGPLYLPPKVAQASAPAVAFVLPTTATTATPGVS